MIGNLLAMNEKLAEVVTLQTLAGDKTEEVALKDVSQAYNSFMLVLFVDVLIAVVTIKLIANLGEKLGKIFFKRGLLPNKPGIHVKVGNNGKIPKRANSKDAGLDLCASESVILNDGEGARVSTEISMEIPDGHVGLILDRSSLGAKGIHVHGGVVDSPYRGEVKVVLWNHGVEPYSIQKGDKIAQIVILPINLYNPEKAESLSTSERGTNGFGSTGR